VKRCLTFKLCICKEIEFIEGRQFLLEQQFEKRDLQLMKLQRNEYSRYAFGEAVEGYASRATHLPGGLHKSDVLGLLISKAAASG